MFQLGKNLLFKLGFEKDLKAFWYRYFPPSPIMGPDLNSIIKIKFCVTCGSSKNCIPSTMLDNSDLRYVKLSPLNYYKKYALVFYFKDIDKLYKIQEGNYHADKFCSKSFAVFLNNKFVGAPIFLEPIKTGIISKGVWDKENNVIKTIGKENYNKYIKIWTGMGLLK